MARVYVTHSPERVTSLVTFWVHRTPDPERWREAEVFDPPLPSREDKGWPMYVLQHQGIELHFASPEEMRHCIAVLSRDPLPTTAELAAEAGHPEREPMHWLGAWPPRLKSLSERRKVVENLELLLEKAS